MVLWVDGMTHERKDSNTVNKDEARTPPSLFKKLDDRWHFDCDACATEHNTLCNTFFTSKFTEYEQPREIRKIPFAVDCLTTDWCAHLRIGYRTFYCNPPYSQPAPFIKKAAEESLKGATVVMLLPADTACKAFRKYIMGIDYIKDANGDVIGVPNEFGASEITFLIPRVVFTNPDGTPMKGQPKFGSMVVVFKQEVFDGSPVISSMGWK